MGLFTFAIKIGIVAYAIDWMHKQHHGFSGRKTIEDSVSFAANEEMIATQEATPRVKQWLHEACARLEASSDGCHRWCRRFNRNSTDYSASDLPNGCVSLEIDVPGLKKEDVVLSVNDYEKVVILKGATVGNEQEGIRERRIETRISLPKTSDLTDLKASLDNGVLRVNVGKKEFEGRRIVIE
ncbi:UNVERIFIED_CONTAM: hypothetical protein HDU68_009169 [Siphonaria sp. JEL0065]|nr:hypothetical protein HDU68_009169 [Siphonaria sp. JEL0065]